MEAPCNWPISYAACGEPTTDPDTGETTPAPTEADKFDPSVMLQAEALATEFLWRWTSRSFGLCEATLRPSPLSESCGMWDDATGRFLTSLVYRSGWLGGGYSPFPIGFGPTGQIVVETGENLYEVMPTPPYPGAPKHVSVTLPSRTVAVTEVRLDGQVLPAEAYYFSPRESSLRRIDGGVWPAAQDLELPPNGPGTFEVNVEWGREVPLGGQVAAGVLAVEFAKALCDDSSCALPKRVQSISRQGITVALDTFDDLEKGHTGIWLIDSWISSVARAPRGGSVASPDVGRFAKRRRAPRAW